METKSEVLKTNLMTLPQIHCESCLESTPHKIVASHETQTTFTDVNKENGQTYIFDIATNWMQVVRCEKCETVSFRALEAITGFLESNSQGEMIDPVSETRYGPLKESRRRMDADESTLVYE